MIQESKKVEVKEIEQAKVKVIDSDSKEEESLSIEVDKEHIMQLDNDSNRKVPGEELNPNQSSMKSADRKVPEEEMNLN